MFDVHVCLLNQNHQLLKVGDWHENASLSSSLDQSLPVSQPIMAIPMLPNHRQRTEMPNRHQPSLPTFELFGRIPFLCEFHKSYAVTVS